MSNEQLVAACEAAMQCIGELSPTQARVEVMQMLQAALSASPASPKERFHANCRTCSCPWPADVGGE